MTMLTKSFIALLEASVTTGVVIIALIFLSSLLNRIYAAKWKYWVWLILALRLLLPFSLSLPQAPVQIGVPETRNIIPQKALSTNGQTITAVQIAMLL
ncbi:MAG: M56 family metallopeptidase, partial [Paludibacter sp.]